ncbi:YfiM family protein [Marinobacterium arenosum]|uniref:YfiM family protein n=1 Tax=Marinobacterium arenosum TaxID=2862496 RepID=UPI001C980595|nr:YfiM family protein [Marinobacterium arenosum]MBY4676797.1 YfiM family protein [Marinobacterium arenosum]
MIAKLREEDKQQHFWYSFFILLGCSLVVPLPLALATTFLVGLAKEIWDHYRGSGFCWYDMLANLLGMAFAWPLALAI